MEDDRTSLMSARALRPGYEILWYTIEKVLGQGGFGITYLAHDRNLDRSVAIKEYLPTPFAYRHKDFSVKPLTGDHRDQFAWGLDSFQKEAQTLAKFGHDNIVRVHSVFEQNNTAYMVMEYEDGENLAAVYQKKKGELTQAFFEQIFFPIFDGLKEIHKFGFIHRDIKPANIYIRDNRTPVLIDFGSARQTSRQQTEEMTTLVTQGYTPLEQYSSNYGEQGPWTDIYALAATIYEGVVGKKPDESLSRSACMLRSNPDLIQPLAAADYPGFSQPFLDALVSGLALEPEKRPPDLNRWLSEFFAEESTREVRSSSSFTELEEDDDRTRIRPPHQSGNQYQSQQQAFGQQRNEQRNEPQKRPRAEPRPRIDSLTRVLAKAHDPLQSDRSGRARDDQFDLGLDDLGFLDDSGIHAQADNDFHADDFSDASINQTEKRAPAKKKRGYASGILAASVLLCAVGAGGYFFWSKGQGTGGPLIDVAMVQQLPSPSAPVEIALPRDIVLQQLDSMQALTQVYIDVVQIDPQNPDLNKSIDSTYQKLAQFATKWNAGNHPALAKKIVQVANQIPGREQQRAELLALISSSDQRSNSTLLQEQLATGKVAQSGQGSLVDLVSGLSQADLNQLSQSPQWKNLLGQYRQSALEKIKSSEFDSAAKFVAAGLTLQPGDSQLGLLKDHLLQ